MNSLRVRLFTLCTLLCGLLMLCWGQPKTAAAQQESESELLNEKYQKLSDEPAERREVRTNHFVLYTDLSERSVAELEDKLENMHGLIGAYFGRRPSSIVECWVVEDLSKFEGLINPASAAKIAANAGVTNSQSLGNVTKAIVYSCSDHGVVQHEAVHAICAQTFGSTGPTWYSEGMAELGQYWIEGELAVRIPRPVARYLKTAEPKSLLAIVAPNQVTGDSWQAYSWRWALCHLLASNPNYQDQFKRLGIAMMRKQPGATFESAFGEVAAEISFEYDQFIENFDNGYRVDLCAWDWSAKTKRVSGKTRINSTIKAAAGWQATKMIIDEGKRYDFAAKGNWQLEEEGAELTADGNDEGNGRMIAAILSEDEEGFFHLSDPVELGVEGTFTAPASGQIYIRCRESWTELSDNDGKIKVTISNSRQER